MAQEVTITPIFVAIDVCENCFDIHATMDYLKSSGRKDFVFINAEECIDPVKLASKSAEDIVAFVAKSMKTKIDQEINRALEAKKKLTAQLEKQRQQIANAQARGKHAKLPELVETESPRFEGKVDMVFIIQNFVFTQSQMKVMKDFDLPITAFLSFVPGPLPLNMYNPNAEKSQREQDSNSKKKAEKKHKIKIPGIKFSWTKNPGVYPPARWDALRPKLDSSVPFREVLAGATPEASLSAAEKEIVRILRAKDLFESVRKSKTFAEVPVCDIDNDTTEFMSYVADHPNDYVNGLWHELALGEFNTMRPHPAKQLNDEYNDMFEGFAAQTARGVVVDKKAPPAEPYIRMTVNPVAHEILHSLVQFKPNDESAGAVEAITNFIQSPKNFHAYAGQKFDQLVLQLNKKYGLNLPGTFFDWQQWALSCENANGPEVLAEALKQAGAYDTIYDDMVGLMWVMTMKPVPRVNGTFMSEMTVPQTLGDISEWMDTLMDAGSEAAAKPSRISSNPAAVIRGGLDCNTLVKPIEARFENASKVYRMPAGISNSNEFKTPYFFDCGVHIEISRRLYRGSIDFAYRVMKENVFEIASNGDSLILTPESDVRFQYTCEPFSFSLFFNDKSMCYNGKEMILRQANGDTIIVSSGGDLVHVYKGVPIVVNHNGTISHCREDEIERINKDGVATINGVFTNKPHSQTVDVRTRVTTVIRPDNIDYSIDKSGKRKIVLGEEFVITQTDSEVVVDIPGYPIINAASNVLSFGIGTFQLSFNNERIDLKANENEYTAVCENAEMRVSLDKCEMALTPSSCQVKSGDQVFISTQAGIESMGTIHVPGNTKRKIDSIETKFGAIVNNKETNPEPLIFDRHKMFPARFFAVRRDFSIVEFIRKDILPSMVEKTKTVTHPCGESVQLLTRHLPESIPFVYAANEALSKPARSAQLKLLQLPKTRPGKPAKGKSEVKEAPPASETICKYLTTMNEFSHIMNDVLTEHQDQYIQEITPKPAPPPEVLSLPPRTPIPRMQNMQYGKYSGAFDPKTANYWQMPESDFGYPLTEPRAIARPLSPRRGLHDAPRFFKPDKYGPEPEFTDSDKLSTTAFMTEPDVPMRFKEEPSREWTGYMTAGTEAIDFGDVKANTGKKQSITFTNTFKRPIHFTVTQLENKCFRMVTIPGVVYPGLKASITVELLPSPAQRAKSSFELKTPFFEMRIPVFANIVN